MRLSTAPDRDEQRAVDVIHAALTAGATLLDTADAYCHDDADVGHNERLVMKALRSWNGHQSTITVATKGGFRRPNGAWVNDGRAKYLREACERSRQALDVDAIDLYQLHAVDPRTPIETSVRALAALQKEGKVRRIGLCNVTVGQIEAACTVAEIASVQISLSVLDDDNLWNGVAEYCRDQRIPIIAYRPLGGERVKRLSRDPALARIAAKCRTAPELIALAWLQSFDADVIPIPGATRVETAGALSDLSRIALDDDDRRQLDERFSGRLLRVPRAHRRAPDGADGEVVLVMGMPGAGKSTLAKEYEHNNYDRLNRDALGGSLTGLVTKLQASLTAGRRRVVLDNTYPSRKSRSEVVEAAWAHGVPARCVWLTTDVGDAQINAILRMIAAHGRLPTPEDIRERSKGDPRYLAPDAQFRYERIVEPPVMDEGYTALENRPFVRGQPLLPDGGPTPSLVLDFDDLIAPGDGRIATNRRDTLEGYRRDGWLLFAHAWRPQIARGEITRERAEASFAVARTALDLDLTIACCPHDAGPPICWCRKPLPGLLLEFAVQRGVSLERSLIVASSAADRTMAQRLGVPVRSSAEFFDASGRHGEVRVD